MIHSAYVCFSESASLLETKPNDSYEHLLTRTEPSCSVGGGWEVLPGQEIQVAHSRGSVSREAI